MGDSSNNSKHTAKRGKKVQSVRTQYSMEEIKKMLGDIDAVVSDHKANIHGVDPEEMIKTVRGGRVVWITKEEMNERLVKNRRLTQPNKYRQRTRRGQDSLASEINTRIQSCRFLIDTVRQIDSKQSQRFVVLLRRLEAEQNQCVSLARDLSLYESAIQRKKQEDPIIQEVEQANKNMLDAAKEQNFSEADLCQAYSEKHTEIYHAKMQRLEPYIKKAREYRVFFLQAKQKIISYTYDLTKEVSAFLTEHLQEVMYHDKSSKVSELLAKKLEQVNQTIAAAEPQYQDLLVGLEDKTVKNNEAWNEFDKKRVQPMLKFLTNLAMHYQTAWKKIQNGEALSLEALRFDAPEES